ncbi:CD70 antigen-like protein [Cricetulus griseus]|nr:CD70 antigen-like protein [Cricetulus griseus]
MVLLQLQGNANQNNCELSSYLSQKGRLQNNKQQMLERMQGKGTLIHCCQLWRQKQTQLKPIKCPVLNPTGRLTSILILFTFCPPAGPRKDPTLRWAAGPALGRSFTHGPGLEKGQLYIHREGIYRLHIQVTLANCSSAYSTIQHRATVAVGICSPAAHSISLLRLPFGQSCTVASQRLTHLAVGDVLCTNLTLPLLPSRNSEETFFGIHWVYP